MLRLCPSCGTQHSVLLVTILGPRCVYCARAQREGREQISAALRQHRRHQAEVYGRYPRVS